MNNKLMKMRKIAKALQKKMAQRIAFMPLIEHKVT
jgi:DNA-binding XRE family transcriptional regulator